MGSRRNPFDVLKEIMEECNKEGPQARPRRGVALGDAGDDCSSLFHAAETGSKETIQMLLGAGAYVNHVNNEGFTPLLWAVLNGQRDVVPILLRAGAYVPYANPLGRTALFEAARYGQRDVVKMLLDAGAHVDRKDNLGWTALIAAARTLQIEVLLCLLEEGADVNAVDRGGYTALQHAVIRGCMEVVRLLLEGGAHVNSVNHDGCTALIYAAKDGNRDVLPLLLDAGADVNHADRCGCTALMWAALNGHLVAVQMLITAGADPMIKRGPAGKTAEGFAEEFGHQDIAQFLRGVAQEVPLPRLLTVRAARCDADLVKLVCTTLGGNEAARLEWPDAAPPSDLPPALIAEIRRTRFQGLKPPVLLRNLRLLKPDATPLAVHPTAGSLAAQFDLA